MVRGSLASDSLTADTASSALVLVTVEQSLSAALQMDKATEGRVRLGLLLQLVLLLRLYRVEQVLVLDEDHRGVDGREVRSMVICLADSNDVLIGFPRHSLPSNVLKTACLILCSLLKQREMVLVGNSPERLTKAA